MALKLASYLFTGPFPLDATKVRSNQQPVVYAIIVKEGEPWAPSFRVLDVGFSEDSGIDFSNHASYSRCRASSHGSPSVYLFYAPRSKYTMADRQQIAAEIWEKYKPANGTMA
jgi:hypothetical protein